MSKTIKLTDETYKGLEEILRPRETFSEAVARLLLVYEQQFNLLNTIEGATRFRESQGQQLRDAGASG